ncbi:MAG: hypothetical protein R2708_17145 [Vicinamibacterales bacterium]
MAARAPQGGGQLVLADRAVAVAVDAVEDLVELPLETPQAVAAAMVAVIVAVDPAAGAGAAQQVERAALELVGGERAVVVGVERRKQRVSPTGGAGGRRHRRGWCRRAVGGIGRRRLVARGSGRLCRGLAHGVGRQRDPVPGPGGARPLGRRRGRGHGHVQPDGREREGLEAVDRHVSPRASNAEWANAEVID